MSSSFVCVKKKQKRERKRKRLGGHRHRKGYPTPLTSFLNIKKEAPLTPSSKDKTTL